MQPTANSLKYVARLPYLLNAGYLAATLALGAALVELATVQYM
jgi:hypothetical protein